MANIESLPTEMLERIFQFLSPYGDYDACRLVSKKWYHTVKNVIWKRQCHLRAALLKNCLKWESPRQSDNTIHVPNRLLHSVCVHDGFMYVFGGISKNLTCFNDLLVLNLTTRKWSRPRTRGDYPSPKSCAALAYHNGNLILHGGCTSASGPLASALPIFSELHIYNIQSQTWRKIDQGSYGFSRAGHSCSVHKNALILVGGFETWDQLNINNPTHNIVIWLDLITLRWHVPNILGDSCHVGFQHSQFYMDDNHFLIFEGGLQSPEHLRIFLIDVNFDPRKSCSWRRIQAINPHFMPQYCRFMKRISVAKVEDLLVAFACGGKCKRSEEAAELPPPPDRFKERNLNGRQGLLRVVQMNPHGLIRGFGHHGPISLRAFQDNPPQDLPQNLRIVRMAMMAQNIVYNQNQNYDNETSTWMYVADISKVLTEGIITWRQPQLCHKAPTPKNSDSLVLGNGELIAFGGAYDCKRPDMASAAYLNFASALTL